MRSLPTLLKFAAAVGTPLLAFGSWAWVELLARATTRAEAVHQQVKADLDAGIREVTKTADLDRQQLIEEIAVRVRLQAASAERDRRKREASGKFAEDRFRVLVHRWPCVERYDADNCYSPARAARAALETPPP